MCDKSCLDIQELVELVKLKLVGYFSHTEELNENEICPVPFEVRDVLMDGTRKDGLDGVNIYIQHGTDIIRINVDWADETDIQWLDVN